MLLGTPLKRSTQKHISAIKLTLAELLGTSTPLLPSLPHRQRRRENMKDGYLLGYTLAYTSGTL